MTAQDDVRKARVLLESAEAKLKSLDRIRVPDGIRFTHRMFPWGRGLVFNDGQQELGYQVVDEMWGVTLRPAVTDIPLYLTPCKRSELKAGDWWCAHAHSSDVMSYNLRLADGKSAYVISRGVSVGCLGGSGTIFKVTE